MSSDLRLVAGNVGIQTASKLLGRLLFLVLHGALARTLGAEGLGQYATATAVAAYFVFAVDLGFSPRLVREGAVAPEALGREYAQALGWKVPMTLLALVALGLLFPILPYDEITRQLCVLLAIASIVQSWSYLNHAACRAKERLDLEAVSSIVHAGVFVLLSLLLVVWAGLPVAAVGLAALAAAALQIFISLAFARRFLAPRVALPPRWSALRAAAPYAATSLTAVAFTQIDVLILSFIASQHLVGQYTSISRLLIVSGFVSVMAAGAILPTASRIFARDGEPRFRGIATNGLRLGWIVGGGLSVALWVAAELLLGLVFGAEFAPLHPVFRIGCVFALLKFATSSATVFLIASGRQGFVARAVFTGIASTAVLNLVLVPLYGLVGAVLSLVGSEIVLVSLLIVGLAPWIQRATFARSAVIALIAFALAGTMQAGLEAIGQPLWLQVVLPCLAYAAIISVTGETTRALRALRIG